MRRGGGTLGPGGGGRGGRAGVGVRHEHIAARRHGSHAWARGHVQAHADSCAGQARAPMSKAPTNTHGEVIAGDLECVEVLLQLTACWWVVARVGGGQGEGGHLVIRCQTHGRCIYLLLLPSQHLTCPNTAATAVLSGQLLTPLT